MITKRIFLLISLIFLFNYSRSINFVNRDKYARVASSLLISIIPAYISHYLTIPFNYKNSRCAYEYKHNSIYIGLIAWLISSKIIYDFYIFPKSYNAKWIKAKSKMEKSEQNILFQYINSIELNKTTIDEIINHLKNCHFDKKFTNAYLMNVLIKLLKNCQEIYLSSKLFEDASYYNKELIDDSKILLKKYKLDKNFDEITEKIKKLILHIKSSKEYLLEANITSRNNILKDQCNDIKTIKNLLFIPGIAIIFKLISTHFQNNIEAYSNWSRKN